MNVKMLYHCNYCWNRVLFEAYEYSSYYLIFVITLIIGFLIFVWIHERSSVYKGSTCSMSGSESKDVTVATSPHSAPHTDYYFGIASKLLTQATCECVQCKTHEYRHIVAANDRNGEETTLINLPNNMIMFRRSKHSIMSSMDSDIILSDSNHDLDSTSLKRSRETHKTHKELDFKSSNDFIK